MDSGVDSGVNSGVDSKVDSEVDSGVNPEVKMLIFQWFHIYFLERLDRGVNSKVNCRMTSCGL